MHSILRLDLENVEAELLLGKKTFIVAETL